MSDEDSGLTKFTQLATRGPKDRGTYETLLAEKLRRGNNAKDPLDRVLAICEAAYLFTEKDKVDMDVVEAADAVCRSLMATIHNDEVVRVPWIFPQTKENFTKYILLWHRVRLRYYPLQTAYRRDKYPEKLRYYTGPSVFPSRQMEWENEQLDQRDALREQVNKEISELPLHECFYAMTSALAEPGFQAMRGEFCRWGLSMLQPAVAVIAASVGKQTYVDLWRREEEVTDREDHLVEGPRDDQL